MPNPTRVTHQQIADVVGVSRTAVTQALHGTRRSTLSAELQREIWQAARELGYQPRNVTTHNVGYVTDMSSMRLMGEIELMIEADQTLRDAGFRLLLGSLNAQEMTPLQEVLNAKTIDGAIFTRWFNGKVKHVLPSEIPWLVISDEDGIDMDVDVVTLDTLQAAESLAQHLIEHGHERICVVLGSSNGGFHERIRAGVRSALAQADLPMSNLTTVAVSYDREIEAPLMAHLNGPNPSTAIMGGSPEKSLAVMYLLARAGYRVPDAISVVSLFDSHLLEPMTPGVTATNAYGREVARTAVARLLEKLADPTLPARQTLVPSQIIHRQSVSRPPAKAGIAVK